MTLNETHGQRLLGTKELLFPSKFKLLCMYMYLMYVYFFSMALQPEVGQALVIEASRLHSDTPHSVELLRTSDQSEAENSA